MFYYYGEYRAAVRRFITVDIALLFYFLLDTEGSGQLVNERNGGDGVPDGATPSPGPH